MGDRTEGKVLVATVGGLSSSWNCGRGHLVLGLSGRFGRRKLQLPRCVSSGEEENKDSVTLSDDCCP